MCNICVSGVSTTLSALLLTVAGTLLSPAVGAEPASGTINYQSKAGALAINAANVYLIKGPDPVSGATIRELIFSPTDIGAKLQACTTMSCASGSVTEGMTIDFDVGPRLNYWVVGNGQKIQYSGTAKPEATLKLTADTAQRLAAKVNVKFDAPVVKQYAK